MIIYTWICFSAFCSVALTDLFISGLLLPQFLNVSVYFYIWKVQSYPVPSIASSFFFKFLDFSHIFHYSR